jgi:hypothetical protein
MADFQVHLESLSDKRKKARRQKLMKPMKMAKRQMARLKGLHHHPRQMAWQSLQQRPPQRAQPC